MKDPMDEDTPIEENPLYVAGWNAAVNLFTLPRPAHNYGTLELRDGEWIAVTVEVPSAKEEG